MACCSVSHVDGKWWAAEAVAMAATGRSGTPRRPVIVGGSGFIGTNLLALLAATPQCERVCVLDVQEPSPAVLAACAYVGGKLDFVQHRLGTDSAKALAAAVEGTDCVFSIVTPHVQTGQERDFYATNDEGIKRLVAACIERGVPRLVFLSSIAASNHFVESIEQDEEHPLPPWETYDSPYDITKRRGEECVLGSNREGFATCALRPGGVLLSPHDFTFRNIFIVPGVIMVPLAPDPKKIDFIDGRDVARGLLLAAQGLIERPKEVAGEAFWLTKGESWDPAALGRLAARTIGLRVLPIPPAIIAVARFFAWVQWISLKGLGFRVSGLPPHKFMTMSFYEKTFNNSKAERVLGYRPKVKISDAVKRICELYRREYGLLVCLPVLEIGAAVAALLAYMCFGLWIMLS